MVTTRETDAYRRDAEANGKLLTPKEREALLKPYLPPLPNSKASPRPRKSHSLREFLREQLHVFVFTLIHTIFSLYVRARQIYHAVFNRVLSILYYHHRTPELIKQDVRGMRRLPEHLSVILEFKEGERNGAGLGALLDEAAEISAWCACVGIPVLSVYEKTGVLKRCIPRAHRKISSKLLAYLGRRGPSLQIRAPNLPLYLNSDSREGEVATSSDVSDHLSVIFLSSEDGRSTLVDLTITLAEMSQRNKLSPDDVSINLIDAEIEDSGMGEPELLIIFGPNVELQGYPPWQVRLTEIFHVQDNVGVGYQIFLRALHSYAKTQMRFGR